MTKTSGLKTCLSTSECAEDDEKRRQKPGRIKEEVQDSRILRKFQIAIDRVIEPFLR
jgi:hypothetical protein